jgi:hypothetical protein
VFGFRGHAAPGPVPAAADEARADGVVEDVLDRGGEVLLVPDHARPEALGEKRAEATVPRVVLARVVAVEPLHRP